MHLCMQVPRGHFAGYVHKVVAELYAPLLAAINGTLSGPGALGTVLLCETLLSYLPTCMSKDQPHQLLRAYELVPLSVLQCTKRLDLRKFAETREGLLYLPRPKFQKVWVPLSRVMVTQSGRKTATTMLMFLDELKAERSSTDAVVKASRIVVTQFKRDLVDMNIVASNRSFTMVDGDGCVFDVMTAEEYVDRVFDYERLPSEMSTKSFLHLATDLFDHMQLKAKIVATLTKEVVLVPRTTIHARSITFSPSVYTMILQGNLSTGGLTRIDAQRMITATIPLIKDYFSLSPKQIKQVIDPRPRLTRCIRNAVTAVRAKTASTRHLLSVVCIVAIILARDEKLLHTSINFQRIYRATNLSRFVRLKQLELIISKADSGELDTRNVRMVDTTKVVRRRRSCSRGGTHSASS